MGPELSKGKTLVVLAIVIGCFAILWPKIFYPMIQGSVAPTQQHQQPPVKEREPSGALCCGVVFENDASSAAFLSELCSQVLKRRELIPPDRMFALCHRELLDKCAIDLEDVVKSDVDGAVVDRRLSSKFHGRVRAQNLTRCLEVNFDIDENLVRAKKSYHRPSDIFYPRHMRPERPPHLHPDIMHPALREKGRAIPPIRTFDKQAKPVPMPGMRPPMGGAPHMISPSPGSGGMGILMPIYTIGIIVFFMYTMMKILFKKQPEDGPEPRIKNFHMDAEHRKYLFAEEYCTGVPGPVSEMTVKEYALLHEQQQKLLLLQQRERSRSKTPETVTNIKEELEPILEHVTNQVEVTANEPAEDIVSNDEELEQEEEIVEEVIPRSQKMDTEGKPIGQWYLPPGFDGGPAGSESADDNETNSDEIDLNDADERSLRLAFAALKAQKEEEVDQLRRRLEETERAMERICRQMGNVTDKLSTSAVELLSPLLTDQKEEELICVPEVLEKCSVVSQELEASPSQQEPVDEKLIESVTAEINEEQEERVQIESTDQLEQQEEKVIDQTIEEMMESVRDEEISHENQSQIDEMIEEMMQSSPNEDESILEETESIMEHVPVQETSRSVTEKTFQPLEMELVPDADCQQETPQETLETESVAEEESNLLNETVEETSQSEPEFLQEIVESSYETIKEFSESAPESVQEEILNEDELVHQNVESESVPATVQSKDEEASPLNETMEETSQSEPEFLQEIVEKPLETVPETLQNEESETSLLNETMEEVSESTPESVQEEILNGDEIVAEKLESEFVPETVHFKDEETSLLNETMEETSESGAETVQSVDDERSLLNETIEEILDDPECVPEYSHITQESEMSQEEDTEIVVPDLDATCHQSNDLTDTPTSIRTGSEERRMTVNVCGVDITAGMENLGKMPTDLLPDVSTHHHITNKTDDDHKPEIPSVYLDASIPPESHLVVSEAECSAQVVPAEQLDLDATEYETSPVVLSGKMTLSVIGMELNGESLPDSGAVDSVKAEESDGPRVRFLPEPTDRIFLIPVEPEEEALEVEECDETQHQMEEDEEIIDEIPVVYRPPTPPLQRLDDAEFLTYEELEEAGEVDPDVVQEVQPPIKRLPSIPDEDEPADEFWSKDSGHPSLLDSIESQIITAEESAALTKDVPAETTEADPEEIEETVPLDEHASIGEMAERIRVAIEEASPAVVIEDVDQHLLAEIDSSCPEDTAPEACGEFQSEKMDRSETDIQQHSQSIQSALDEMVDTIISQSITDSVTETHRLQWDNTDAEVESETNELSKSEAIGHVLMDVEYQIIPTSEDVSTPETDTIDPDSQLGVEVDDRDYEQNRDVVELEHALEQTESLTKERRDEDEGETEPSISGFTIREDYPEDEEEPEPMTEEEILQARQEIEEIKKLLADVSSGVVHHPTSSLTPVASSNIVTELAYAMAEDGSATVASKGSSPDMDEYEVIQTSRPTEMSEPALDGDGKTSSTISSTQQLDS